jgi:hypothetical protein
MTRAVGAVVALGKQLRVQGFALAAVPVVAAEGPAEVLAAWRRLPDDVDVLILTPMAARALAGSLSARPRLMSVVLPP